MLVGTIAVETSEYLSELLTRRGIPHNVLNAKQHEREARDHQGRGPARRGHDRDEHGRPRRRHQARRRRASRLGGLYVLGTERHEARRIDNQLRGRSGRQGDPGESRFYLSGAGRPRPPVRRRPDLQHHRALQDPGRPADGGEDPLAPDRERAEEGRGAELRRAQERPQVRRRDEQAAHGDLRAAPPRARGRGPVRGGQGSWIDEVVERAVAAVHRRRSSRRSGTSTALVAAMQALYGTDITVRGAARGGRARPRGAHRGVRRGRARRRTPRRRRRSAPDADARASSAT